MEGGEGHGGGKRMVGKGLGVVVRDLVRVAMSISEGYMTRSSTI